jgi:TP901 family phage tail tape measure protein
MANKWAIGFQMYAVYAAITKLREAKEQVIAIADEYRVLQALIKFDDKTSQADASAKQIEATAMQLSMAYGVSAQSYMEAATELMKAGLKAPDVINSLIPIAQTALSTGEKDIQKVAKTALSLISTFRLDASKDMSRVANQITYAVNKSKMSVETLAQSMKYSTPMIRAWGKGVEEALGMGMVQAAYGYEGSLAGTGIRQLIKEMTEPTKKLQAALKAINVEFKETGDSTFDFLNAMQLLNNKGVLSSSIMEMFGSRAGQAGRIVHAALGEIRKSVDALKKEALVANSQITTDMTVGAVAALGRFTTQTTNAVYQAFKQNEEEITKVIEFGTNAMVLGINKVTAAFNNMKPALAGLKDPIAELVAMIKWVADGFGVLAPLFEYKTPERAAKFHTERVSTLQGQLEELRQQKTDAANTLANIVTDKAGNSTLYGQAVDKGALSAQVDSLNKSLMRASREYQDAKSEADKFIAESDRNLAGVMLDTLARYDRWNYDVNKVKAELFKSTTIDIPQPIVNPAPPLPANIKSGIGATITDALQGKNKDIKDGGKKLRDTTKKEEELNTTLAFNLLDNTKAVVGEYAQFQKGVITDMQQDVDIYIDRLMWSINDAGGKMEDWRKQWRSDVKEVEKIKADLSTMDPNKFKPGGVGSSAPDFDTRTQNTASTLAGIDKVLSQSMTGQAQKLRASSKNVYSIYRDIFKNLYDIQNQYGVKTQQAQAKRQEAQWDLAANFLQAMSFMVGGSEKSRFEMWKKIQTAYVVVSTISGAALTYTETLKSTGKPWAAAAAAAAVALEGMAQLAAIKATSFQVESAPAPVASYNAGTDTGGSGFTGSSTDQEVLRTPTARGSTNVTINVSGFVGNESALATKLGKVIKEAVGDGVNFGLKTSVA